MSALGLELAYVRNIETAGRVAAQRLAAWHEWLSSEYRKDKRYLLSEMLSRSSG